MDESLRNIVPLGSEAIGKAKDVVSGEAKKGRKKAEKAIRMASDLPDWMSKKKA